jgi:hypothetical protein
MDGSRQIEKSFDHFSSGLHTWCIEAEQGDHIGRIFAYWAIVYYGLWFEK